MLELFISWFIGTITGAVTAISIETLKNHNVEIEITAPDVATYPNKPARTASEYAALQDFPAKKAVYLCLKATNYPPPRWARWITRNVAVQCRGEISFLYESGLPVFNRPMPIRWVDSPEPLPMHLIIDNKRIPIYDPNIHIIPDSIDIYPDRARKFNIAAKFDDEEVCYGWNNENYSSIPEWRNPSWKIPKGRYYVVVDINICGSKVSRVFALFNESEGENFRLGSVELIASANKKTIKKFSIKNASQLHRYFSRNTKRAKD